MTSMPHTTRDATRIGNSINLVLGVWLAISAFVWSHAGPAFANTLIVGVLIAVIAAMSFWRPAGSAVATIPAAWLLLTTLFIHHDNSVTPLHNALVGALVVFAATTPLVAYPEDATPGHVH